MWMTWRVIGCDLHVADHGVALVVARSFSRKIGFSLPAFFIRSSMDLRSTWMDTISLPPP